MYLCPRDVVSYLGSTPGTGCSPPSSPVDHVSDVPAEVIMFIRPFIHHGWQKGAGMNE